MDLKIQNYLPFVFTSIFLIVVNFILGQNTTMKLYIFSAVVLIGGLPHGALDFFILKKRYSGKKFLLSLLIYLLIALSVFVLFYTNPLIIFILFLIYSAFHFGDSDFSNDPMISRLGWGSIIVLLPLSLSSSEAVSFISLFVQDVNTLNSIPLFIVTVISFFLCIYPRKNRESKILLCVIYIVTIFLSNIYFAFASYFTAMHSVHHLKSWIPKLERNTAPLLSLITLVVLIVIGLQLGFKIIQTPDQITSLEQNAVYTAITMLGALTVPHMILINKSKS